MDRYILAEETLSLAEWTSVLKLSAMWEMHRLHQVMVNRMSTLTATVEEWTAVFKLDMSVRQLGSLPIGYLPAVESSQNRRRGQDSIGAEVQGGAVVEEGCQE